MSHRNTPESMGELEKATAFLVLPNFQGDQSIHQLDKLKDTGFALLVVNVALITFYFHYSCFIIPAGLCRKLSMTLLKSTCLDLT